jgi:CelD/BcsL family acetyltransferase involved in cellulose biosynthesis
MSTGLTTEIITDPAVLERERAGWDAVAVSSGRPYCSPGWALPWWSAVRPPDAELRAVAVRDGSRLVGMAPFYVSRDRFGITTWRLLADITSSYVEPVAEQGRRTAVAAAIAGALRDADRDVDVLSFATVPRTGGWPALLREQWPGRPPTLTPVKFSQAPYVDIPAGGYDGWLAGLTGKSRKNVRAAQREFARSGGTFRRATTPDEIAAALDDFVRLHLDRWQERGGSDALTPAVVTMLRDAGRLMDPDRLQVWTADVAGEAIGSAVIVAAGAEMHSWLGGFDERWSRCSPSMVVAVETIRHAADAGFRRLSLGPGASAWKYRLATGDEPLESVDLLPFGRRSPYVRLCRSPYRFYRLAADRTPPVVKQRIRASAGLLRRPA